MYYEFSNIGTNASGQLVFECAFWRNQADYDAGIPCQHCEDFTMARPILRQVPVRDAQGRFQLASDGSWITSDEWEDQEVVRQAVQTDMLDEMRAVVEKYRARWLASQQTNEPWPSDHRGQQDVVRNTAPHPMLPVEVRNAGAFGERGRR